MAKAVPPNPPGRKSRSGNPAIRSGQQPAPPVVPKPLPLPRSRDVSPVAVDPAVLPPAGAAYPQILRGPSYVWWRSMLGVMCGLSLFLLLTTLVSQVVIAIGWALTAADQLYAGYVRQAYAFERPVGMLGVNLGIATLIPIALVLVAVVHRVRAAWLASVQPGIRWKYLLICLVVALVALNGVQLLSQLVVDSPSLRPQVGFWGFLVVIVLTSPLQAAAEEIFFRGYLMQALGSLVAQPWFGVVVSAVVFALLHGTQNLPLFVNRLAFGLLAAVLVWRTGGLEAGIAAHIVNNVSAYVLAGLTTSIAGLKAVQGIGWAGSAFNIGGFAVFAVLAYLVFRILRLRDTVQLGADLRTAG